MAKQMLIYEKAVPLTPARHRDLSLAPPENYAFSAELNAVPLMAVEFLRAASEYAIVFAPTAEGLMPAAVLGLKSQQNLYLTPERQWQADYVPAFIRRYPFVFAQAEGGKSLVLCIDEAHPGLNRDGRGQALFDTEGKPSAYTQKVLQFLQQYQLHYQRTRAFGERLKELDVLEPMRAKLSGPSGQQQALGGFFSVSREKLRKLPAETLAALARNDELELLYLQLHSMRNFSEVKDRAASHWLHEQAEDAAADGQTA